MDELKNVLEMLKNVSTNGESTIIMAQCMIALSQYIATNTKEEN